MAQQLKTINVYGYTKGKIMDIAYNNDRAKLGNVDVALPLEYTKSKAHNEFFWFVMDYNTSVLGEIVDLRNVARENNIKLISNIDD